MLELIDALGKNAITIQLLPTVRMENQTMISIFSLNRSQPRRRRRRFRGREGPMTLSNGEVNKTYTIRAVNTADKDMQDYLFTLGCYPGESITIIAKLAGNYIVNIKDARYSIDDVLAKSVII